ncbi:MAG: T9SS type A sorting domain-containing protein [Bacteroidota bacterium]
MKKKLLSFLVLANLALNAQAPSPDWSIIQNTNFPQVAAGIRYMDAVSPSVIWATGYDGFAGSRNYNWFTTSNDGGNTFAYGDVFADTSTYCVSAIEGISGSTAYITAYMKTGGNKGVVYKTIDAGANWQNVAAVNMYTAAASFANITCFTDSMTGITMGDPVGGEYEIHRTIDGGATWTKIPGADIPNPLNTSEYGLTGVYTKNANDIWYGTNNGRVFHSADAGLTWTVGVIPGASVGVSRLAFRDNMNGLSIAFSGTAANPVTNLYRTSNGGLTWTNIGASVTFGKNDICAIPGTTMFASCGAATNNSIISYSTDDGSTWIDWGSTGIQYLKIDFVDNMNGWAGTFSDQSLASIGGMYKYSGVTTSLKPLAENVQMNVMPNPSTGIVSIDMPFAKRGLTIEVIDAMGKVVYSEKTISTAVGELKYLNLEHLSKGLYTVTLKTDTDNTFSKIVLQ